jgi:hypothetical protein
MSCLRSAVLRGCTIVLTLWLCRAPAFADSITFDFEGLAPTARTGALSTLSLTVAGLTVDITRPGSVFDIVDNTAAGQLGKPSSWGSRSLDPFFDESSATPFNLNFSTPVTELAVEFGDYAADAMDVLTLNAYSGLNGTGMLVATIAVPFEELSFPGIATARLASARAFRSIRMIGGTSAFPNSVFYDTLSAQPVPEPASLLLLGSGLAAVIGARRRNRRRRS